MVITCVLNTGESEAATGTHECEGSSKHERSEGARRGQRIQPRTERRSERSARRRRGTQRRIHGPWRGRRHDL